MKNHWLIDDQATRQEIHNYVRESWSMIGVENVTLSKDQMDFCIDHAVRHITNVDVNLTNCFAASKEDEVPTDTALVVAKYYRELKYRKVNRKDMGTACLPSHDWVVMYFSKQHSKWEETLQAIKAGALCCSYVVLHNSLPKSHPHYITQEVAQWVWDEWKEDFSKN